MIMIKLNIFTILGVILTFNGFVNSITLTDRKTSQIEVDFFRFLFPFDEFFNTTNISDLIDSASSSVQTTTSLTNSNIINSSAISSLSEISVNQNIRSSTPILETETLSTLAPTIIQTTALISQSTGSILASQNPSLDQIQAPSDYILHRLYRKFLEQIKRQTYPTIKINPSQTVNTNIPADLNICTDQYSTNENGNTYCIDSTGEKRPVYEVIIYTFY
jgi:hypothetical protein